MKELNTYLKYRVFPGSSEKLVFQPLTEEHVESILTNLSRNKAAGGHKPHHLLTEITYHCSFVSCKLHLTKI